MRDAKRMCCLVIAVSSCLRVKIRTADGSSIEPGDRAILAVDWRDSVGTDPQGMVASMLQER